MTRKNFFITIIITNFNKEKFIKKAIQSALNQNYHNFEVIVVDNNSTDKSRELIINFKKIKLLNNKVKKTGALNQIKSIEIALKKSKGSIICLMDGDDLFKKNKLKEIAKFFQQSTNFDAVCDIPIIFNKFNFSKFSYNKKRTYNHKLWPTTFPTSSISVKKEYLIDCINKFYKTKFKFLEIDFRLCCLFSINNNYQILKKNLTYYRQVNSGIMSGYKKFRKKWWIKRAQAFDFFFQIKRKSKKQYSYSFNYFLTKFISNIYNGTYKIFI